MASRSETRAFVAFDSMIAALPVLLMLLYTLKMALALGAAADEQFGKQQSFDKLVSAADYLVNYGLAKKDGGVYYPNWIVAIDSAEVEKVRTTSGLNALRVGLEKDDSGGTCIYRLIVYGEDKSIRKLYFCGE